MEAPVPPEAARLAALHAYGILDTPPEPDFDALTRLASRICGTPMALLTLVDGERQWFKSRVGLDVAETPRDVSFCAHAIERPGLFVVTDALQDPRFAANPFVVSLPHIRFYAGAPLVTPEGHPLGTLCVVDRVPRRLSPEQMESLDDLARQAMGQMELRRQLRLVRGTAALHARAAAGVRAAPDSVVVLDGAGRVLEFNPAAERTFGRSAADAVGRPLAELLAPGAPGDADPGALEGRRVRAQGRRADGSDFPLELAVTRVPLEGPPVFTAHLRDITERVRGEAALEHSVSLLQAALESTADGLLVVDHDGRVVTTNRKFAQMWGLSDEVLAAGDDAALAAVVERVEEPEAFLARVRELYSVPEQASFEELRLRDGRVLERYSQPQRVGGRTVGRVWSFRDVTERRHAEAQARRTAERMRAVAQAAAAVVGAESRAELRAVLEGACRRVLPLDAFFIFGYDAATHTFAGFGGYDSGVYTPPTTIPAAGTPGERVVRERRSLLTLRSDDAAAAGAELSGTGRRSESIIRTPIVAGDEVLGILSVQSYTPERFGPDEVEVVEALASLAATALCNLRLTGEREAAEEALRRSESRFRALFEQFPFSIHIFSPDGRTVRVNRAWRRLFPIPLPRLDAFNPLTDPQLEPVRPLLRRAFEAGEGAELPDVLFDPGRVGTPAGDDAAPGPGARWIRASVCPVRERDGGIGEVIIVHQDVTEERRSVAELRERERRLAETQRIARLGSWEWEGPGGTVAWSDELFHIFGLEPQSEEVTLESFLARVHPDDRARVRATIETAVERREAFEFEHRVVRPDGATRTVYGEGRMVTDAAGRVTRVIGVCQDITERRAAEEALRESEARYRALIETASDAIVVVDERGTILSANRATERTLGYTPDELVGQPLSVIQPPRMQAPHREGMARYHATGERRMDWAAAEVAARRKDGTEIPVEISIGEYVRDGRRMFAGFLRDITERKAAERALREARDELERRVEERTAELAEANMALEEEVAERTRAEEEVVQKSAELQAVFHALPDLYLRMEHDGTVLDCQAGRAAARYADPAAFVGRRIAAVLPPAAARRMAAALREVAATGGPAHAEYALALDDGTREFEARLLPLRACGQVVAVVRDITDRKEGERELLRREERFRTLIENGSDLIAIIDRDGITRYLSPSARRLLGWEPEERIGRSSMEMIHPDDRAQVGRLRDHAVAHPGQAITVEYRYRHGDGSWRVFEAAARTLLPGSADEGLVVNARDVTERHEAEAALRGSEEHFRALIENASDLITIMDATGVIRYQSPAVRRLFGYTPEEMVGTNAMALMHPDDVPAMLERLGEVVANPGTPHSALFRFRHGDGSWRYVEAVGATLSPDSAAEGLLVNSRDVTERLLAQEALEAARAEAERAREAAEAANRAKSEFLSRMSHELRTPMNSILGFAQLIERRDPTDEQRRSLDQILRAGRHLLNLINEVLDIARIEADRQTLSLEPVRVDTALGEAVALIRPLAVQHGCHLAEPLPATGFWVRADRQRLAQVLLNLLSNAIKYNRPGGSVRVTWEAIGEPEVERFRIGVHDTGRGIPAERMAELFVPFARLGAEESGVEGTGLGLALSHRLAEAMGGTLHAESTAGRGSTFWLELPAARDPVERLGAPGARPRPRVAASPGRPATVLYVEDNLANLALVESILTARPEITLLSAMQGRMGLDLAWEHAPDLVLLDLHLPDMPGAQVLRHLREDPRTRDTRVVVISADATPGQVERLRAAGAHDYMTKPLDVDAFLDAVDRSLATPGGTS